MLTCASEIEEEGKHEVPAEPDGDVAFDQVVSRLDLQERDDRQDAQGCVAKRNQRLV